MGSGGKWSKFVAFVLMFAVALLFNQHSAEAKGKKFKGSRYLQSHSQAVSKSSAKCVNGECRSKSVSRASSSSRTIQQSVIQANCPGRTVQAFRSDTVKAPSGLPTGNLQAIAIAEASSGAPNEHVFTAREIADAAGVGSVFVGVGWRGQTCQHPGKPSAEATVGNKTVRIWIL